MVRSFLLTILSIFVFACAHNPNPGATGDNAYLTHTVRYQGETLGLISAWYTGASSRWLTIAQANPNLNVKNMRAGDVVRIPNQIVRRTDPLPQSFLTSGNDNLKLAVRTPSKTQPEKIAAQANSLEPEKKSEVVAANEQSPDMMMPPPPVNRDPNQNLYMAVQMRDAGEVKSALNSGADINFKQTDRPMLAWAAQNGDVAVVQALLDAKASVNAQDGIGHTALMRAADTNQLEVVKTLLNANADVNIKNEKGKTALILAIQGQSSIDLIKTLLDAGANPNAKTADDEFPAMIATQDDNIEVIKLLGEKKADFNVSNAAYTPLSYAIDQEKPALVEALLNAGADPNAKTSSGRLPLIQALSNQEIFGKLIAAKADPNGKNGSGDTVLLAAIQEDANDRVEDLINAGADLRATDEGGRTALNYAESMSKNEIVEILKKHGAS